MLDENSIDILTEFTSIGLGRAGALLNDLLEGHVDLDVPTVDFRGPEVTVDRLGRYSSERLSVVRLAFTGSLEGSGLLVFAPDCAANLVAVLSGEEEPDEDLDSLKQATLSEVGNIVLNSLMGTLANLLDRSFDYRVPSYFEADPAQLVQGGTQLMCVNSAFSTQGRTIEGEILLKFTDESLSLLNGYLAACYLSSEVA